MNNMYEKNELTKRDKEQNESGGLKVPNRKLNQANVSGTPPTVLFRAMLENAANKSGAIYYIGHIDTKTRKE